MRRFEFYKELHFKEEEKKNKINNSLSLPISIITGIIAASLYLLTNFDFKENLYNTIIFLIITLTSLTFLAISIFHIIKPYSADLQSVPTSESRQKEFKYNYNNCLLDML